jgi:salicylate hydroxylase
MAQPFNHCSLSAGSMVRTNLQPTTRRDRRHLGSAAASEGWVDARINELAAYISEVGAGVQISPSASRLLLRLGLTAAMDAVGVRPGTVHQRRWDNGRTLQRASRARGRGGLRRAILPLPPRLSCQPSGRCAAARAFTYRSQAYRRSVERRARSRAIRERTTAEADLLVGADGIHSRVCESSSVPRDRVSPAASLGAL